MLSRRDVLKALAGLGLVVAGPKLELPPVSAPVKYYQLDSTMLHRGTKLSRTKSGVWTPYVYMGPDDDTSEAMAELRADNERRWKEYVAILPRYEGTLEGTFDVIDDIKEEREFIATVLFDVVDSQLDIIDGQAVTVFKNVKMKGFSIDYG